MTDSIQGSAPRTVVVTGATGLIGSALVERLRESGHRVRRLVRRPPPPGSADVLWDPMAGQLNAAQLEGVDAVVHLAGEPLAQRWTDEHKRLIRESRVRGTDLLARALASLASPPAVLVSGSAIGYYGDRGDELLDESSTPGADFLAAVVKDWEQATAPSEDAGIRVVLARTGVVLSPRGGALEKMLLPFKLGLGGPLGGGAQWMSWISLDDQVSAMERAINDVTLRGPVNMVAPNPVTNAQFAAALGRALHRPALLPVPSFALELMYGEMADATVLAGQRVRPAKLEAAGFSWRHPELDAALRAVLN